MNCLYMGIDTSNYTTSISFCDQGGQVLVNYKQLLPVKKDQVGLRQSDACFAHIKNILGVPQRLLPAGYTVADIAAIGVSTSPTTAEGSYMPCFMVGNSFANLLANLLGVPLYTFSHQQGHIMAALYGANALDLLQGPFLAFHVSGGTTDMLLVKAKDNQLQIQQIGASLDLKAGQAVDRVGHMLGIPFPAGPQLDQLACKSKQTFRCRPVIKGLNCCLSGLENQCQKMLNDRQPSEDIARYCIEFIQQTLAKMTAAALNQYGTMPILFAGGVMSNTIIQDSLSKQFGGRFAPPVFSSDNAAGISLLCYREASTCHK